MPRAVVIALSALLSATCSGANGAEPRPEPAEVPAEPPAGPSAREEELPEPDPSSTCGRALACCRAYAAAIPDVVEASACRGVFEAASAEDERRCRAMSRGWREALARLGDAPEACD
ncbi:MAG: hypothetical protein M5U28_54605 [Sandaracinaceae bacterium]|nr:hypothetical protein [Sandaracinaceae bacterium]